MHPVYLISCIKITAQQIVQALSRKHKTAKAAVGSVQLAFQDLTGAVGNPSWIREWEQLEAHAMKERGEAMMIYNVTPIQGSVLILLFTTISVMCGSTAISQAGKRDKLLSKIPSKEGNQQVQWIWAGMLIELEQYVINYLIFSNSFTCCFQVYIESGNPSTWAEAIF